MPGSSGCASRESENMNPRAYRRELLLGAVLYLLSGGVVPAQAPPTVVRFTEALSQDVQGSIRLPGSVESPSSSRVATQVSGIVEQMRAREGTAVRRGEVLAVLDGTNLELQLRAVEAQFKEAEARLQLAESNLARARDLFASEVVAQQQLDDAISEFTAWQGKAEDLAAQRERIETDRRRCSVRAPFGGVVVAEHAEAGEWLDVGATLVELLSLEALDVRVQVPEKFFRNLVPGGAVKVRFDALPGHEVQGQLNAIIPRADPQARTFPVKVRIANSEGRIGVGMLAEVWLPAGDSYRATVVPKDAVITRGLENFVFLLEEDDTVRRTPVQSGDGLGAWIVVQGGIEPGQRVIVRGNERLQEGQTVAGERMEVARP